MSLLRDNDMAIEIRHAPSKLPRDWQQHGAHFQGPLELPSMFKLNIKEPEPLLEVLFGKTSRNRLETFNLIGRLQAGKLELLKHLVRQRPLDRIVSDP